MKCKKCEEKDRRIESLHGSVRRASERNDRLRTAADEIQQDFKTSMSIFGARQDPDAITHCPIKVEKLRALQEALQA